MRTDVIRESIVNQKIIRRLYQLIVKSEEVINRSVEIVKNMYIDIRTLNVDVAILILRK